jgi:hypothetical protein
MKQADLVTLIQAGDISDVVFFKGAGDTAWAVHAYGNVANTFGNCLKTGRTNETKTYTSLDRAHAALRELGYFGPINIDG